MVSEEKKIKITDYGAGKLRWSVQRVLSCVLHPKCKSEGEIVVTLGGERIWQKHLST